MIIEEMFEFYAAILLCLYSVSLPVNKAAEDKAGKDKAGKDKNWKSGKKMPAADTNYEEPKMKDTVIHSNEKK